GVSAHAGRPRAVDLRPERGRTNVGADFSPPYNARRRQFHGPISFPSRLCPSLCARWLRGALRRSGLGETESSGAGVLAGDRGLRRGLLEIGAGAVRDRKSVGWGKSV